MPTLCACGLQALGNSACYWCLKAKVDWSHDPPAPNGLSDQERAFVGIFPRRRFDGWRQPDRLSILQPYGQEDTDEMWMSDEEQRLLQILADPPTAGRETEIDA